MPVLPRVKESPLLSVAAVVLVGLTVAALGSWRPGAILIGLGLLLGGGLRLSLPPQAAGLLVVRSRTFDAGLLLTMGFGLLLLAITIPTAD